ncbi:MAG: DUF378 domain-containing protein [Hyphomicrobiaceae bacterium]|nr:DUF378 domain-containing protein [Hyphomicrobiaceae bacterium]
MKTLNLITLILTIIGGLNWGLIGLFDYDLITAIFGNFSRLLFVIIGLSALYQLVPFSQAFSSDEVLAERGHGTVRRDRLGE